MPSKPVKKKPEKAAGPLRRSSSEASRQVVEVVEEAESVPEAIETIKRDTVEIDNAVSEIEEHLEEVKEPEIVDHRSVVQSLFAKERDEAVAPAITISEPKEKSMAVWIGLMLGIVAAVGFSLLLFVKGPTSMTSIFAKPTPTPTETPIPQPTTIMLNRKDIKVSVVNGGGVSGAGAKMKVFLEELGYTVTSVGNSSTYNFDTTEINVKPGRGDIAELLQSDLKLDYSLGSTSATLEGDVDYDALVTVGKEE